jgi:hypothetical protein
MYETEDTSTPKFLGPGLIRYPFSAEGDLATLEIVQQFIVRAESYAPLALNTAYSSSANLAAHPVGTFFHIGDTDPVEVDAGIVSFTRTWGNVPAPRFDYETFAATFPGIAYTAGANRLPFQRVVNLELQKEYFQVGAGLLYTSPGLVPVIPATAFQYPTDTTPRDPSDFFLAATTTPTSTDWLDDITAGLFSYVVEASTLERYKGNIYVRSTRRVRPL